MRSNPKFIWTLLAACVSIFLSLPAFARPANPRQDQGTPETQSGSQSASQDKKQEGGTSPSKEVGKGGADIGQGATKGAKSLGKGTAGAAGNLATLHPGNAAADLGKGAAGAGKDVGVGTGKGAAKIGKGSAKGVGKVDAKVFHPGSKKKQGQREERR